jgi:hypothetical protein
MDRTWAWAATLLAGLAASAALNADEVKLPGVGQAFELDMGAKRVNWNYGKWTVLPLQKPVDLSKAAGLRITVATEQPRTDAGVYVAVREDDGTWYIHPWAVDLAEKDNTGTALFDDFAEPTWCAPPDGGFQDENGKLDTGKINAIAFGCINPFGVGKVRFTVTAIATVPLKPGATTTRIEVTGKLLDVNGTAAIPAGVFGGFSVPDGAHATYRFAMNRALFAGGGFGKTSTDPVTHMMVNCYGDRGQVPPIMTDPNWQTKLRDMATRAATAAKESGKAYYVEWWNEPYLNWSNKNRMLYSWTFFDDGKAQEGGPVHLKSDGSVCPFLKWTKNFDILPGYWLDNRFTADGRDNWRRGADKSGKPVSMHAQPFRGAPPGQSYQPGTHPPKDLKDGETYKANVRGKGEVELTAMTPWWVYDQTQFTFWSAKGAGKFYNETMLVAGKALKAVLPETTYIAGWGFRASEDHWAGFDLAYKPTIDYGIEVIDGINDHDYGGDALKMAANYEAVTAYGVTKHKKWLYNYNTETASGADPEAYPGVDAASRADANKFTWTARKLIHLLAVCPDKVRSLAWFGRGERNAFSAGGEGVLFTMLRNLRGKLVQTVCDDPFVYAVAGIDGADPQNPRPDDMPQRKELVVCLLNDHQEPRSVELNIKAPAGMKFEELIVRRPKFEEGGAISIDEKTTKPAAADSHAFKETLPGRGIVALTFVLSGQEQAKPQVRRKQFFGANMLAAVTADKPVAQSIAIPADDLKNARSASVRFVVERLADGEGIVTVNGKDLAMPKAITPDNVTWVRDVAVPVAQLKESNDLSFKVSSPAHAGYHLVAASILLDLE